MGMNTAIAALLGGLLVGGVVMVGIGIAPIHQLSTGQSTSLWTRVDNWFSRLPRRSRVHGLTGLGIGVVGYVVTGWAAQAWRACLLYTSPSPRDRQKSRMPSSA